MIGVALGYLVPLGFVFAGLWDGRDVVVIFWIESLIVFFYAMLRLAMMIDMPFWEDLIVTIFWSVFLVFLWAVFAEAIQDVLRIYVSGKWGGVGALLNFSYERNGWVAASVIFAIHGIEEVKRYKRTKGYRNIPKDIGLNTVKFLLSMFAFMLMGGFLAIFVGFGKASSVVLAVCLVAGRMAIELWIGQAVPASDSPPQEKRKADIN